jgi:enoyl-CoA hydratase/carnithine racemase
MKAMVSTMNVMPKAQTASDAPILLRRDEGPIAVLTLNRPKARNALSEGLIAELASALDAIAAAPQIKAVVIHAEGPVFSSGHDLKELTARRGDPDRGRAVYERVLKSCAAMMQSIIALPQPVIAAVEGTATAAGCQLVATCDLAVAGEAAQFSTPGVHIGLFCSTPMVALSRNVSHKHAMEMLLLGEMVPAADAFRMGLVNRVVPQGQALAEALRMGGIIASKAAPVMKLGKKAFYEQAAMPLKQAYEHAAAVMTENMLARDAQEGIGAFLDKRPPVWD